MKIHILGICGTFMGGLAQLCCQKGWDVTGSDQHVYPPMSDQLRDAGIVLHEGFDTIVLTDDLDMVVIGNAMSRGNPVVEAVLDRKIPFVSGPELLGHLTTNMTVLAVSGTHGKTTTTSMLAWILESQGLEPGFLIGGVPRNFSVSARLGSGQYFVVEADEYDTAFFDKRSKFVHYHPDILGINNLEFDHADIFADLTAIETQFHHVIRRVPGSGCVISRSGVEAIDRVLARGCWSRQRRIGQNTEIEFVANSNELISDRFDQSVRWTMRGTHNAHNAELAVAMAHAIDLPMSQSFSALAFFEGVARRLNLLYETAYLKIWDDFAHHPTAIKTTLNALSDSGATGGPLIAVIELRSNTMKAGLHGSALLDSTARADRVIWVLSTETKWDTSVLERSDGTSSVMTDLLILERDLVGQTTGQIVFMSNGGFSGIQSRVVERLQER
ncbi:UDP-N-acetylmuramate:L-alanyl-gamma-D-glutamyl-meso-diaminopimelate ligase [Litorivicinus sp.]|nr:UDP-N-acetylmuramate:L-alanyl-gamma-D-glutamyl-meso-diaminopimelate ligase [Litorivicinus sp.]